MNLNTIVEAIGDFFYATFEVLPFMDDMPNYLFIAIGSVAILYWLGQLRKFQVEQGPNQ